MENRKTHIKTKAGWLSRDNITDWLDIHRQYTEGKSLESLGKDLGIRRTTVRDQFKKFGLPTATKEAIEEKRRKYNLEKYGVEYPNQSKEVNSKKKQTCLEKYGVEYSLQSDKVIEKRKQTNLEKYGYVSTLQVEEVKQKIKETCLEKYGTENTARLESVINKRKQTCLLKYGVDHPNKCRDIKDKALIKNRQKQSDKINEVLRSNGYEFLDEYALTRTYAEDGEYISWNKYNIKHIVCGNVFEASLFNVSKIKCPYCYSFNSTEELNLRKYVSSFYKDDLVFNSRSIIPPYELDIYLPKERVAFEYNGVYWHSTIQDFINKTTHKNKSDTCQTKDIKLFYIWDFDNIEIVKSLIKSKLNEIENNYYARKLKVKQVNTKDRREFFSKNHLHGDTNSSFALGLYEDENLVQCISFRKHKEGMEIARFSTALDTKVAGGFSKLLKHSIKFIQQSYTDIPKIITYCDRDWTTDYKDSVYYKNGFTFIKDSGPILKYYNNNKKFGMVESREKYQKHKLEQMFPDTYDDNLTADEILSKNKIYPFYNSGNWKFELNI